MYLILPVHRTCIRYDVPTAKHQVLYDGEDTDLYVEDLESGAQQWEVARPLPERRGLPARAAKPESFNPAHFSGTAGRKCTYVDMALEVSLGQGTHEEVCGRVLPPLSNVTRSVVTFQGLMRAVLNSL